MQTTGATFLNIYYECIYYESMEMACALNPASSTSILRQATGDDGGGGCDDGSGGCDGDGCDGGDGPRWMHGLDAPPSGCGWRECK